MLRWFFRRQLDSQEKQLGQSMDYLRHIVNVSPAAFIRFCFLLPFVNSRRKLPQAAWSVAQLAALREEDCGPCLQIGVNLARQNGVDAGTIRAAIDGQLAALSPDLADVYLFTKGVLAGDGGEDAVRETLRARYGEHGLIELAYAIASSRIPPTVKRALGYAQSCSKVSIDV